MTAMAMKDTGPYSRQSATRSRLWYVRRDNRVQGPYSKSHINRFLLLGRILPTDRVSTDGQSWAPLAEVKELVPDEVRGLRSDTGWHRFVTARAEVDERGARDRAVADQAERERRRLNDEQYQLRIRDLWMVALNGADAEPAQSHDPKAPTKPASRRGWVQSDYWTTGVLLVCLVLVGLLFFIA